MRLAILTVYVYSGRFERRVNGSVMPGKGMPMQFVVLTCCAATVASASPVTAGPSVERYLGTGRACYGALTITPKTISWLTPFSQCQPVGYQIVEHDSARTTFRLSQAAPTCRYRLLSLTHDVAEEPDKGWNVTGYRDERSYRAHKASGFASNPQRSLSCYLIRDPEPTAPLDW